jgi:hypothetical protein
MIMKNPLIFIVLTIMFSSCISINRLSNEAIYHAFVGQNENIIYNRLGMPSETLRTSDGGKKMIYELHSKGMATNLNKSKLTFNYSGDMVNQAPHMKWKYSTVNTETNDPKYNIYQVDKSFLELLLNKDGECEGFQQNLTKSQSKQFYERFKKYIPKDRNL